MQWLLIVRVKIDWWFPYAVASDCKGSRSIGGFLM